MGHRGIPPHAPDFDENSLRGKPSDVGFLGVEPVIAPKTVLAWVAFIAAVIALYVLYTV